MPAELRARHGEMNVGEKKEMLLFLHLLFCPLRLMEIAVKVASFTINTDLKRLLFCKRAKNIRQKASICMKTEKY